MEVPEIWYRLQHRAVRARDTRELVAIIDQMNAFLTEEEQRSNGNSKRRRPPAGQNSTLKAMRQAMKSESALRP